MEIRRPPGYPLLLTLGVLADRIAAVTIAVQILLGTATVWMVALLARRVIGAGTGDASRFSLWAAAAYALDPLSILYPSLLLTETLFTAVFVVHLLALLRFLETRAVGTAALAGVLAAVSTFVRPVAYFWPFIATAIMLCTLRRAGIRGHPRVRKRRKLSFVDGFGLHEHTGLNKGSEELLGGKGLQVALGCGCAWPPQESCRGP